LDRGEIKMKKLIVLITVLFSINNVFASTCATEIIDQANYTRAHDQIIMMDNSGAEFSEARVKAWNKFFAYDLEQECIDMMDVTTYQGASGKIYIELTTNADECDGGNVFGIILDLNDEVVGEIGDSDYYCPTPSNPN
jgi:hypothetical protein